MNILLVGARGNLGRGCSKFLARLGHEVLEWDKEEDVLTLAPDICRNAKIELIVNFSVIVESKESNLNLESPDFKVNVLGLNHLLRISMESDIPLIQISTREVIGLRDFREGNSMAGTRIRPVGPYEPCLPEKSYGITKLIGEFLLKGYASSAVIRLNTCYTDDVSSRKGLIANLVYKSVKLGQVTLDNNGEAVRDPLHIDDLTSLILRIHETREFGKIYHAGGGEMNYLTLRQICKLANPSVEINSGNTNNDHGFLMDISLATQLDWKPKIKYNQWVKYIKL